MVFDKYFVAYRLKEEGIGRKIILKDIYNKRIFNCSVEIGKYRKFLNRNGIEVVSSNEKKYPSLLKQISDYPLILFVKGNKYLLNKKMVTMVGTRKMSKYGKWAVKYILKALKEKDVVIVSGLAKGIDAEVHSICLKLGIPTIGVVAGGFDKGYPKSNQDIYNELAKKGLIISEFPPGRKIIKGMFPMRNRILAGISSATIIVESDITGGSLITMNLALEYNRDIFAIPCDISRLSLQGCNMCISQGAEPLYCLDQISKYCINVDNN